MTTTAIETVGVPQRRSWDEPLRLGGAISALGAVSVVITSAFYVASPRAAAGPVQPLDLAAAVSAAHSGAGMLHAAGMVGVFGDLVWAVGALLLAQELGRRGRGLFAAGWIALFLSIVIFTLVDGMTGYVFPPLAAAAGTQAFEGFKRLWDMLFLLGATAFGAGAVAAFTADLAEARPMVGRALACATILVGLAGGLVSAAALMGLAGGLPVDKIAGASIGLGAILFVPVSLQIARYPDRS